VKRFSVIIPCYRMADLLVRCIKSVMDNRDWSNIEIIVVMDNILRLLMIYLDYFKNCIAVSAAVNTYIRPTNS